MRWGGGLGGRVRLRNFQQLHPHLSLTNSLVFFLFLFRQSRKSMRFRYSIIRAMFNLIGMYMQSITFHVARIFRSRLPGNKGDSKLSVHTVRKVGVNESRQWAQSTLSGRLQEPDLEYEQVQRRRQRHRLLTLA